MIILGGPISASDTSIYLFINDELALISHFLSQEKTIDEHLSWRAAVSPAPLVEIGLAPSHLTEQGKQSPLACFAEQPLAMHCGQNFTLPEQAE